MTEEQKKETETKVQEFEIVNVATQTTPAIKTPEGDIISEQDALVLILNKLKEIKKFLG